MINKLKEYFENTPKEQILKDWEEVKEMTKDVNSPTIEQFLLNNIMSSVCNCGRMNRCGERSGFCPKTGIWYT